MSDFSFEFVVDMLDYFFGDQNRDTLLREVAAYSKNNELHGNLSDIYKKKNTPMALVNSWLTNSSYYDKMFNYTITQKAENALAFDMELERNYYSIDEDKYRQMIEMLFNYRKYYLEQFSGILGFENIVIKDVSDSYDPNKKSYRCFHQKDLAS